MSIAGSFGKYVIMLLFLFSKDTENTKEFDIFVSDKNTDVCTSSNVTITRALIRVSWSA